MRRAIRWLPSLSIRWRITIGSVLVGAVLLTAAAFAFRLQIEQVQIYSDKKLLYDASTPYLTAIKSHPDQIDPPGGEQHVAVLNASNHIVVSNLPENLEGHQIGLTRLSDGSHFTSARGSNYLVIVRTVHIADGDWHVLATRDERLTAIVLDRVTGVLAVGVLVLLVGFGIASWLLTGAALRPVTQMRLRAETLRASGSDQPLPVGPANDELAALATTLNEFISSVRATAAREKQMVSDASHELRTPIAVLKAQLELAHLSEGDPAALKADLDLAEESVDRLSGLATNLLTLSSLEAGDQDARSSWRAIVEEFGAASDRARLLALDKHVAVDFDVDDGPENADYPLSITHFGQIVDNLVSNAARAVPETGRVSARLEQRNGLRLSVEDSGPGMPPEFIPVAFDRFTRPDEPRGGATGGSGLGLAIVHAIVSNAGGDVTLANRVAGFEVTVWIPPAQAG
ncbi:MAG: HAMP domain-containing histidine kinase [Salinibacterium sp.]|nr:MAG: HAMP domain-containing histidine kinase [Salinibacterium sp.]